MAQVNVKENPVARFLFGDTRTAILWLVIRLYVGWQWLEAGLEKFGSDAWTGSHAGTGIAGFVGGALKKTTGPHIDVQPWYASFLSGVVLPNQAVFSYLITFSEIAVGVGLILGCLTGIAAFGGVMMNANYLLAGTVSVNPLLIILGTFLILAWRVAGLIGVDYFLLHGIGTPWQPGRLFRRNTVQTEA